MPQTLYATWVPDPAVTEAVRRLTWLVRGLGGVGVYDPDTWTRARILDVLRRFRI